MGMRLIVEIVVGYPDLSMQKHVDMLKHHFKNADISSINIIDNLNREEIDNLMSKNKIQVLPVDMEVVEDEG